MTSLIPMEQISCLYIPIFFSYLAKSYSIQETKKERQALFLEFLYFSDTQSNIV